MLETPPTTREAIAIESTIPEGDISFPAPEPLEADTVRIMLIGTALWFAGFLVLLPFRGRLADDGHEVWLWTCLAGGLLGLLGLVLATRARTAARARAAARRG